MSRFIVKMTGTGPEKGTLETGEGLQLEYGSPQEFGGPGGHWTPEDMLVASVVSCLQLTTMFFVKRAGIHLQSLTAKAAGDMGKTPEGLRFSSFGVKVQAVVSSEDERSKMEEAIRMGEKYCPVSAALKHTVEVVSEISVKPA